MMRDAEMEPPGLECAPDTLEKMQDLLQAKDDTSRFVGFALLKSVLDNGQLVQDQEQLRTLWEALSPKFLDRLLRAKRNQKITKTEAQNMVDLAVAVLHTFTILLPENSRKERRVTGRAKPLVKALIDSGPETTTLIFQTLLTIVSQPEGALEMLNIEDLSPLTELAIQYPLALDILRFTWTNSGMVTTEVGAVRQSVDNLIPTLLNVFNGTDGVTFISFIGDLFPKLAPEALSPGPKWLQPLVSLLRKLVISKPTLASRAAYTQLAATLLQAYPATCPALLFKDDSPTNADAKPFCYLFINLLLIDLRSSFPTLLSQLNNTEYPAISQRLAAAFDVISSFIGFLVRNLDEETSPSAFSMPPDLLLKLRKDLAETISLSIEYLRDRWDASIAGASGLDHSARMGTAATSEGTRLTITWESRIDSVNVDALILAAIRTVAIWIREDENENLRNESAGLMDMLVELYKISSQGLLEFRYPILLALEALMTTEAGADGFLEQGGWQVVFQDLETVLQSTLSDGVLSKEAQMTDAARGLEIIRVLLAVIDHPSTQFPREDWMRAITTAASMKLGQLACPPIVLELQIAMLQLATALLSIASSGMQRRYANSNAALSGLTGQLESRVKGMGDNADAAEFTSLLEDVALDLENLRVNG